MYPNCTYAFNALIVSFRAFSRRLFHLYSVTLVCAVLLSTVAAAQCIPPSMTFRNPVLISGVGRQVGAIYRFSNVTTGVDATIQIVALVNGAALSDMDNTTQGYPDAWQPYVTAAGNTTSYLDWKITFKKGGTNVDTLLPCLAITAIDIDGDGSKLREFIVASTPGAYAVDPNTLLTVSFDGVNSTATGVVTTVPSIDTAARKFMFQMNFANVSTIYYRNGSISQKSATDPRHTCIYFKSFFETGLITLPVRLLAFTAKKATEGVRLEWTLADEKEVVQHEVQKSTDGLKWENLGNIQVQQNIVNYSFVDKTSGSGRTYYRLLQTGINGSKSFSRLVGINHPGSGLLSVSIPTLVNKNIPIQLETPADDMYHFAVYNNQGIMITQRTFVTHAGINILRLELPGHLAAGMYTIAVRNTQGLVVNRSRVIVQ